MPTTYRTDIRPKFRPNDIACMRPRGVLVDSQDWMCDVAATFGFPDHGNARRVHNRLTAGNMPPDGAWPADWLAAYESWMVDGFLP